MTFIKLGGFPPPLLSLSLVLSPPPTHVSVLSLFLLYHHHRRRTLIQNRSIKKGVFLVLRHALYTVQATVFVGGNVGRPMVQYAEDIAKESVIDVRGTVVVTPSPVSGCTQKEVELKIEEVI